MIITDRMEKDFEERKALTPVVIGGVKKLINLKIRRMLGLGGWKIDWWEMGEGGGDNRFTISNGFFFKRSNGAEYDTNKWVQNRILEI